jgi:methionine-rich copper-binding protein CopC
MTRAVMVIGLLLMGALGMSATIAQGDPAPNVQITAYPVGDFPNRWFEVDIAAGESITLTAGVTNNGAAPVTLRAFAANAESAINGGFSASTEDVTLTGPALWVDAPAELFDLAPGASREWDLSVTVPPNTAAGQYVAALVISTDDGGDASGSDVFRQVLRSTMAIEITVPGPLTPSFETGPPAITTDVTGLSLEIPIANTGNVLVEPQGELVLQDANGGAVFTASIIMGSVYAGHTTSLQVSLPSQVPPGQYLVSVNLTDPATGATASIEGEPIAIPTP